MRRGLVPPTWLVDSAFLLEAFITINLAFLALDIYVAHSMNEFRHWAEWIPFYFSISSAIAMAIVTWRAAERDTTALSRRIMTGTGRWVGLTIGWASIAIGIAGLLWHLQSTFFRAATLKNLVYSAPFIAPLAYTGIGLLLLTNRTIHHRTRSWNRWVLFLAWAGFLGNFGLSLLDHAQNGFFFPSEWIPVGVSALAVGFLAVLILREPDQLVIRTTLGILILQVMTGILGLGLHLRPLLDFSTAPLFDRIVHGAPVFAPLLFVNLALLAGIGVWESSLQLGHRVVARAHRPEVPDQLATDTR